MAKQWYEYDYGLLFGEGDSGIGGEHGTDFNTPLFTPITALLPGTISGIQTGVDYGLTVTWKLDTPYKGVPYMYNIHLAALAPGIQKGAHINAGAVIGYSGGATPESLASDLANTPYQLPAGLSNYLDGSNSSGGAHVEVGFTYNSNYGEGGGFYAGYLQQHPELNPKEFLDRIRGGGIGMVSDIHSASGYIEGEDMTIDLSNHIVASYFTGTPDGKWQCKANGNILQFGMLHFYRSYGKDAFCGVTYLGLPLSNEIPIEGHPGVVKQEFERGWLVYDPQHEFDHPPGAGEVYLMHLPK